MRYIITQNYSSPVGDLLLGSINDELCLCDWKYRTQRKRIDIRIQTSLDATYLDGENEVLRQTVGALNTYFLGEREVFDIPIKLVGTPFQQRVWRALQKIKYGKTTSYQNLANSIGQASAVRAVANANGANALSIIVPCHRVIGKNGKLTGYAGGLSVKRKLLELEKQKRLNLD